MTRIRAATPTVAWSDESCAHVRPRPLGLSPRVRLFEPFSPQIRGMLADTTRKSLPRLAKNVRDDPQARRHLLANAAWSSEELRASWLRLTRELDDLRDAGLEVLPFELYSETPVAGALGHSVRLPLGIHRLTDKRYALFDERGYPCAFTSAEAAVRFIFDWPCASSVQLVRRAGELRQAASDAVTAASATGQSDPADTSREPIPIDTRSAVILWVDAHVAIPDPLAEIAPSVGVKRMGRGNLGWCPFHDDRAPDALGRLGTPSFYAVLNRRHGWSWRCLSSNCAHSMGPMRHSFRLWRDLQHLSVSAAIAAALDHWPSVVSNSARFLAARPATAISEVTQPSNSD